MTNEIRTRRLIVTLPVVSGEEADVTASTVERSIQRGGYEDATVDHPLDDAPLDGFRVLDHEDGWDKDPNDPAVTLLKDGVTVAVRQPEEMRKLAALLLRAADDAVRVV
ncbi:hypothetical protein [Aeromicrobium sp. CTD01-1L150]|uniref:hypothetical protein n=1 Tax=Aeromicrobium sp. CTD01-1L150 TaxID=3341830 RepID=UPI0035C19009